MSRPSLVWRYSLACAMNASRFISPALSAPRVPPAIFMKSCCVAITSWLPSRPGAVGGELGLARPLEDGEPDRQQRDARQERQGAETHVEQDLGDGAIERMAAHHVTHLVGQQHPELVFVEQLDGGRVHHDERIVDAVGAGVEHRRLRDVQLGHHGPVEGGADFDMERVGLGELIDAGPHGVALEQEADAALAAQDGDDLPDHVVEAGNRAQGLERGAIGGVLPGDTGDLGERDFRAGRRNVGHSIPPS